MKLTLYHFWRFSLVARPLGPAIKGLPFSNGAAVDSALRRAEERCDRARNPIGHVPAWCFEDGRALGESVAILEYLDELVPAPAFYPRDPWKRARVRQLVETINAGVQPLQNLVVLARVSPERRGGSRPGRASSSSARAPGLRGAARRRRGRGRERALFHGERAHGGHFFLVPQMNVARRFKVDVSAFARCLTAEAAALATPHAAGALPESQPGAPAA